MSLSKVSKIYFKPMDSLNGHSKVALIYDSGLSKYKNELLKKLGKNAVLIPVKAQETSKSLNQVAKIFETLSKSNLDKKSVIVALGGGVIGDIAGFVASSFLRGIKFVSIPTTILSQVDSSIGGKNGVNLKTGKNLIGTFYQPDEIFIDYKYLKTLNDREIVSGLGEVLKYSILDKKIKFQEFSDHKFERQKFIKTIQKLTPACVSYKMKMVRRDERDEKGIRQVLNLGHTFAHALETLTSYKTYKHGEAVIWGIKFACVVSYARGFMKFEDFRDIMNLANKLPIPNLPKNLNAETCYQLALKDKKSHNKTVKMVLIKKMGSVKSQVTIDRAEYLNAVELLKDFS